MSHSFIPSPNQPVCFNCRYYLHAIGIGAGLRCRHPNNKDSQGHPPLLPGRMHTCKHFEQLVYRINNEVLTFSDDALVALNNHLEDRVPLDAKQNPELFECRLKLVVSTNSKTIKLEYLKLKRKLQSI